MSRYRYLYLTLLLSSQLVAVVAAQSLSNRTVGGFIPRHERLAASVLRRSVGDRIAASTNRAEAPGTALTKNAQAMTKPDAPSAFDQLAPPPPPVVVQDESLVSGAYGDVIIDESGPYPMSAGGWVDEPTEFSGSVSGGCAQPGCGGCANCRVAAPCWIDTFSLNLGVHGFKGGLNRGESGSFGIEQGTNWGSPAVFGPLGLSAQFGFRTTQNDGHGADFTTETRQQYFVTAGFFHRARCGLQGGVVFDYLHDDWYSTVDLGQVRGEVSWVHGNGTNLGLWFASNVSEDTITFRNQVETYDTQDIVAAFYRMPSLNHALGRWRLYAGFTGNSDGIIGTDFRVPLPGTWALEPEFTYVIPDESAAEGAHEHEAWNVGFNLVWYPGRGVNGVNAAKLPLFDVAGNGSMISRRSGN